jgi:hypothetical protein
MSSPQGGPVRYSSQVQSISHLKANAAEILASYEATQETLALLKVLARLKAKKALA